jgi:D-alanyl-D-alanine carboxypeptidase (penicillin-binding protein 5/6)
MILRRSAVLALAATVTLVACDSGGAAPTETLGGIPGAAESQDSTAAPTTPATTAPATTTTSPPTTEAPTTPPPTAPPTAPPPTTPSTVVPTVEAAAYAVLDMRSGVMLASNQADTALPVASLIKLLTAQTAYAAGQPTKIVVAPEGMIIDPEESQIGLSPGQELPRDLLIRAMLIVSANDAARALAVDIAGSEQAFAEQMNAMAAALGLANTHAVNATGLDAEGQYSSANDLINLAAFLMGNPTFQLTARRTDATLNERTFPSTNDLLTKYPGADGIKTGHTTAAGWCIVASATRDGRRIIAAVLGAPTEEARDAAATALLDWGFTQ